MINLKSPDAPCLAAIVRRLAVCAIGLVLLGVFAVVSVKPAGATDDNIYPACYARFFDPNHYNWYSYRNECGAYAITIKSCTASGGCGLIDSLGVGETESTGFSQEDINHQGGIRSFACRAGFHPVAMDGVSVLTFYSTRYRCVDL